MLQAEISSSDPTMRNSLLAASVFFLQLTNCGPAARTKPEVPVSPERDLDSNVAPPKPQPTAKTISETRAWSEVPSTESSSAGVSNRKSRIVVTSDPTKHGGSLHFRFHVNAVPISGIFVATGGGNTTFTLPIGTVHFTVDECNWEMQGFELAPGEEIPIACRLTKDGDCCEVALPDEDAEKAPTRTPTKRKPSPNQNGNRGVP